jgi:hypothetical protein
MDFFIYILIERRIKMKVKYQISFIKLLIIEIYVKSFAYIINMIF